MKKWTTIGILVILGAAGIVTGIAIMGVRANDSALEKLRDQEGVVELSISGMD